MDGMWNELNIQVDYFVNRACTVEWQLPETQIDFHNLMYLYSGQCDFFMNGRRFTLQAGDVVYAPFGTYRKAYTSATNLMRCYAASFQILSAAHDIQLLPAVLHIGGDPVLLDLLRQIEQVWLEKDDGYALRTRALLLLVLSRLHQAENDRIASRSEDFRIMRIKRQIAEKLTEKLTVQSLAEHIGLNPVYLGHLFHRQTGQTIHAYIARLRIQKACDLLRNGRCSVKEAAWQCGFDDICAFCKIFKRITGHSPSAYGRLNSSGPHV